MSTTDQKEIAKLKLQAEKIRRRIVELVYNSKSGHIGGSLSSVDIETALYFHVMNVNPKNPKQENRDRFLLSKGHCVEAYYSVLSAAGFVDDSLLDTYGKFGTILAGHPTRKVPGIELNSGALGHGLSVGVGVSVGAKMNKQTYRTFVLMGDGEQGEGSIYEAAMAASYYKLDNLVAIIDRNKLQISGTTEAVMSIEPMRQRWEAFGWEVFDMEGNNMESVVETFDRLDYTNSKPKLLIAHTTKGCGVSFMENNVKWHHGLLDEEQFNTAVSEIDGRIKELNQN